MEPRRWPSLWKWIGIYLRVLLSRSPTIDKARKTAGVSDEAFLTARRKTGVRWLKPLFRFYEVRPMPEFMCRFLDEVEQYLSEESSAPSPPPLPPRSRWREPLTPV
jgi:hypothetical protein